ncbi:MAG TPA: HAD family hydrolase [Polyangia bacterium]|jgi:HAD superfamily hydrolase (TIGR01549 family)|nr:HAD family hydrolase [Polyangia bacterium]
MGERTIIFDVDGTLVDSNDAHALSWTDTLAEFGISSDVTAVRRLIGMGGDKLLAKVAGLSADSDLGRRIVDRRTQYFRQTFLKTVQAFPCTGALFRTLVEDGVKIGIASSAPADELASLLSIAAVSDLIEQRSSSDDVQSSKPDPDVVKAALHRLQARPQDAIMVGDTPYDVEAAKQAGVRSIAFRCGGWGDSDLAGAIAIYDGPENMLAHYRRRTWQ